MNNLILFLVGILLVAWINGGWLLITDYFTFNKSKSIFSRFKAVLSKVGIVNHFNIKMVISGLFLGLLLIFNGCKSKQVIVERENIVYVQLDSTHIKDSIVIVPIEKFVDVVPQYDTLYLSTSIAEAKSWIDSTNHILRGEIKNLKAIEYKYIEVERIVKNDSIVEKEVPKPYPVVEEKIKYPWWTWITLIWFIVTVTSIIWSIYKRLKK